MDPMQPTVIKKYANRRLYNTGTSAYVTLDDLAEMVKAGEDFEVVDAKTGEDLTRSVLSQIIFEQEAKGGSLMPVNFLRQMIKFYGDNMQTLVPSYLEMSMRNFSSEQEKFQESLSRTIGSSAAEAMEEQARKNMAMFEKAYKMFSPFAASDETGQKSEAAASEKPADDGEIDKLKQQLADMQSQIAKLADKS